MLSVSVSDLHVLSCSSDRNLTTLIILVATGNSTSDIVAGFAKRGCKDKHCVKKLDKALDMPS